MNLAPSIAVAPLPIPLGGETLVNTTISGSQTPAIFRTVAALTGGGYVATWSGNGAGDGDGVFTQRYTASGTAVGTETLVNVTTSGARNAPTITALSGGGYVVAWVLYEGSSSNDFAFRRYDASGNALGGEVVVDANGQIPSISALSDGGFVLAWGGSGTEDAVGIYAQRYDSAGAIVGDTFPVNTTVSNQQRSPSVSGLGDGGFVISWLSDHAGIFEVYSQRYNALGVAQGGEVQVSQETDSNHFDTVVAGLSGGGYVVTWMSIAAGRPYDVRGRQYDASGNAIGDAFAVNTTTEGAQANPTVTALGDGGYVVLWIGNGIGDDLGMFGQRYDASGAALGSEFRVSTTTSGIQGPGSTAALSGGEFVAVWGGGGSGDSAGIFQQRFATASAFAATEQVPLSLKGAFTLGDPDAGSGILRVTLAVDYGVIDVALGTSGASVVSGNGTASVVAEGTLDQLVALLDLDATSSVTYTAHTDIPPAAATLTVTIDDQGNTGSGGALTDVATATINITAVPDGTLPTQGTNAGLTLDEGASGTITAARLDFDDAEQADGAITYTVTTLAAHGAVRRNGVALGLNGTFTQADIHAGLVTYLHDGSETVSDSFGFSVSDGEAGSVTGRSFAFTVAAINDAPTGTAPALLSTNEGVPVAITGLSLSDAEMDPAIDEARAKLVVQNGAGTIFVRTDVPGGVTAGQILNNGTGSPFFWAEVTLDQLNTTFAAPNGVVFTPAPGFTGSFTILLGMTDGGVAGRDPGGSDPDEEGLDLFFDAVVNHVDQPATIDIDDHLYLSRTGEAPVSEVAHTDQDRPVIRPLTNGGYVVVWDNSEARPDHALLGRLFAADGTPGAEFVVSSEPNETTQGSVAALPGGGFVVAWYEFEGSSAPAIRAQRFDATGAEVGGLINVAAPFAISLVPVTAVTSFTDGSFVVAWTQGSDLGADVKLQRFNASGTAVGGQVEVLAGAHDSLFVPKLATLADGSFVVLVETDDDDHGEIVVQRYTSAAVPIGGETAASVPSSYDKVNPSIAALGDGGFLVTWASVGGQDGSSNGVYARRFDSTGTAIGSEFRVNDVTAGFQGGVGAVALPDGGFVVTFVSAGQDGAGDGVFGAQYAADGTKIGEFRLSDTVAGNQSYAAGAGLDGAFVAAWVSSLAGVPTLFTQQILPALTATEQVASDLKGRIALDDPDGSTGSVTLSVDFGILQVTAGGSGASVSGSGTNTVTITGTLAQIQALLDGDATSTVTYLANSDAPPASAELTVTAGATTDTATIAITAANDAPDLSAPTDALITKTVHGPALPLMQGVTLTDPDLPANFAGGSFSITVAGGGDGYLDLLAGSGFTLTGGSTITETASGHAIAHISAIFPAGVLVSALTVYATPSVVEALIHAFGFQITDSPSVDPRTVTLTFNDGQGGSDSITQTLVVPYNPIEGTGASETIPGTPGADAVAGRAGDDRLEGGAGDDKMAGGLGDDTYVVDSIRDLVSERPGEGVDTVETSVSYTLPGLEVEHVVVTGGGAVNVTGNAMDNHITGNGAANSLYGAGGDDRIDGGGGADVMAGGIGDDVFVVDDAGDRVKESAGQGSDTIESWISYTLGQEVEKLVLLGTDAINGSGNDLANVLTGNGAVNYLSGGGGADRLDGGGDADVMKGGLGDDVYVVDSAGDKVQEKAGEGTDTVESSVSYALPGLEIEKLVLTGTDAIDATGNAYANVLTGNGAANRLFGYDGNDTLEGGDGEDSLHGMLGADTMEGGAGADRFYFDTDLGAGNVDAVTDFEAGVDAIWLRRIKFDGVAAGAFSTDAFVIGAEALDAGDRILYDSATGALYYDSDGTGTAAAIQFATLSAGLALTASDFVLF